MNKDESIQKRLLDRLNELQLDERYYGLYEKLSLVNTHSSTSTSFSVQREIQKLFDNAKYFNAEQFYRCVNPLPNYELWFHIYAHSRQVEFGLYFMLEGKYLAGGTLHRLARDVAQRRQPGFEYKPRFPRLPYANAEMLNQALRLGYEILQEVLGKEW